MRVLGYRERIWEGIMGNAEGKKLLKMEDKFEINCPAPSQSIHSEPRSHMDVDPNLNSIWVSAVPSFVSLLRPWDLDVGLKLSHSPWVLVMRLLIQICCELSLADLFDGQEEFGLRGSTLEAARAQAIALRFVLWEFGHTQI